MYLGRLRSWGVAWKELGNEPPFNGLRLAFQSRSGEIIVLTSRQPRPPQKTLQK
jgi:hypothetical protein